MSITSTAPIQAERTKKAEGPPVLEKTTDTLAKKTASRTKSRAAQGRPPAKCPQDGSRKNKKGTAGKNQKLGKLGEDMACVYLGDNDITIIERNWQCRAGEADIIAVEDDALVFIEVKTRSKRYPGLPEYAVTAEKRARYERIALAYLTEHKRRSGRVRFDVIAIRMTGEQQCFLRHHRDAFGVGE